MYFLSGLPRSGSTLLGTLLSQRPNFKVSATSSLIDIMGSVAITWENLPQTKSGDNSMDGLYPLLKVIYEKYYNDFDGTIIDKSRGWPDPAIIKTMKKVLGHRPKIIATVRPIAECLASFMKISNSNLSPEEFVKSFYQHIFLHF